MILVLLVVIEFLWVIGLLVIIKNQVDTLLNYKQNVITSTNQLHKSRILGLINRSTTMLSSFVYVNLQVSLTPHLDLNFENKQQKLTNTITINGIQLMMNNMSLKTIFWRIVQAVDK